MKLALAQEALAAAAAGRPAALITHLATGQQCVLAEGKPKGALTLDEPALQSVAAALRDDRSARLETAVGAVFVEVFNPPLRCLIVGAVHIAQPLAQIAALAGYRVVIVDPRRAFASETRFPGVELVADWPDEAFETLRPDRRSAIVTLTHDPKIDDPALSAALRSEAFYIGALGSKRTHAARRDRLAAAGFSESELGRIHGPVGLDIGALSPAEIAVSIMAQITLTLRQGRVKERKAA